jgi:hypothetical protein
VVVVDNLKPFATTAMASMQSFAHVISFLVDICDGAIVVTSVPGGTNGSEDENFEVYQRL